jgi:RNase P protein component
LRRRLREAVRERADLLEPDTAYLVGADAMAATMSFAGLSESLARALATPDREPAGSSGPVAQAPERQR